ncbi:MAG: hypothetical protein WCJ64_16015 [Rhodospirillaceae bacterium]
MKYVLFMAGALLISSPSYAQTQTNEQQHQSSGIGNFLVWSAGAVGGILFGDYVLGGNMASRWLGIGPQYGHSYVGTGLMRYQAGGMMSERLAYAGARVFLPRFGILRIATLAGSGLLGGWLALNLTK